MVVEVMEGDARNVLCEAVERHQASILVVGSHVYGAIKRYSLKLVPTFSIEWEHPSLICAIKFEPSLRLLVFCGNLNALFGSGAGRFWEV